MTDHAIDAEVEMVQDIAPNQVLVIVADYMPLDSAHRVHAVHSTSAANAIMHNMVRMFDRDIEDFHTEIQWLH